jgi:hypothetical protein
VEDLAWAIERDQYPDSWQEQAESPRAIGQNRDANIANSIARESIDFADDPSGVLPIDIEQVRLGGGVPDDVEAHGFGRNR